MFVRHSIMGSFVISAGYLGLLVSLHASELPKKSDVLEHIRTVTATADNRFTSDRDIFDTLPPKVSGNPYTSALIDAIIDLSDQGSYEFVEPGVMSDLQEWIENAAKFNDTGHSFRYAVPLRSTSRQRNCCCLDPSGKNWRTTRFNLETFFVEEGECVLLIVKEPKIVPSKA